jgi:hypothetical protein
MNQNSDPSPIHKEHPWLEEARNKRSLRTTELGKRAIDHLVSDSKEVSYANISQKSRELDPNGKGVHPNTIRTNPEIHSYYMQYSNSFKKNAALQTRRGAKKEGYDHLDFCDIKIDRNLQKVRKRYKQLSKAQLIERLILTEQFMAEQVQSWIAEQFGAFPKKDYK